MLQRNEYNDKLVRADLNIETQTEGLCEHNQQLLGFTNIVIQIIQRTINWRALRKMLGMNRQVRLSIA